MLTQNFSKVQPSLLCKGAVPDIEAKQEVTLTLDPVQLTVRMEGVNKASAPEETHELCYYAMQSGSAVQFKGLPRLGMAPRKRDALRLHRSKHAAHICTSTAATRRCAAGPRPGRSRCVSPPAPQHTLQIRSECTQLLQRWFHTEHVR